MIKQKASMESLNALHDAVAQQLLSNLDDPKTLAIAVKFLKDNDVTADIVDSEDVNDLQHSIQEHLKKSDPEGFKLSVTDMLELAS